MGILDNITQMKSEGKTDSEIIQTLQGQGFPPKNIQDALNQAQIKRAVAGTSQISGMQQSIIDDPPTPQPYMEEDTYSPTPQPYMEEDTYSPTPQPFNRDTNMAPPIQPYIAQEQNPPKNFYPQENYESQDQYATQDQYSQQQYSQGQDTTSLIEISEQVFADKIKKVADTIDSLNEFKILTDTKVATMETRLKRIESTIDQLQISILDKIGSYGQNLGSIKKEMAMMQDSFGKMINPVLDKVRKRL